MTDYDTIQSVYYGISIATGFVTVIALPAIANHLKNCYTELKGLREDLRKQDKGLVEKVKKE